ncbi:MAG: phosphoribosylamine--glycine ligase [Oscillospiraceae bacterium]|nr:phosphoribosylamine--glycine ligase [Oscillospiraceae bacterium]
MKVLVIGGGGREHAIVRALLKSPRIKKLYCAPGNGGISRDAVCVPIKATDIDAVVRFAKEEAFDLVFVAPDDPLALGLVDSLEEAGLRAFGPRKNAAVIESSKAFAKDLMEKYGIPTASHRTFSEPEKALEYLRSHGAPVVVKADGLALGKGVTVAATLDEAERAILDMMEDKKFGASGSTVVIEDFMTGPEVTVLAFTDGKTIVPLPSSRDHKRAFDGDKGPNTGGMGAISPAPDYTPEIEEYCMKNIFRPTIAAMASEGRPFKGVIYFGLMLTKEGPKVIEYNARFGDPEAQAVLPLLETDLADIIDAVIDERLAETEIKTSPGAACCVVLASGGYPAEYKTGFEITGLNDLPDSVFVYHAGTVVKDGKYFTSGGRVLGVTAPASDLESAVSSVYDGVSRINFKDMFCRRDIGRR